MPSIGWGCQPLYSCPSDYHWQLEKAGNHFESGTELLGAGFEALLCTVLEWLLPAATHRMYVAGAQSSDFGGRWPSTSTWCSTSLAIILAARRYVETAVRSCPREPALGKPRSRPRAANSTKSIPTYHSPSRARLHPLDLGRCYDPTCRWHSTTLTPRRT